MPGQGCHLHAAAVLCHQHSLSPLVHFSTAKLKWRPGRLYTIWIYERGTMEQRKLEWTHSLRLLRGFCWRVWQELVTKQAFLHSTFTRWTSYVIFMRAMSDDHLGPRDSMSCGRYADGDRTLTPSSLQEFKNPSVLAEDPAFKVWLGGDWPC